MTLKLIEGGHGSPEKIIPLQKKRAEKLLKEGLALAKSGEYTKAIECFKTSAETNPSSEAYTYWGWMMSFLDRLDQAILLCKRAIEVDPTLGNPYNDIGTYYMKMGELGQAVYWLELAKKAERYENPHYPYLNLGRIYLSQCDFQRALIEFEVALQLEPQNSELRMVVERIRARFQHADSL